MAVDIQKLVAALKQKRESEGLSLRRLSARIGVSFSTLARIQRGEGEPDNNSLVRILEWLGEEGRQSGLSFEDVAFVHFRAAKNVQSKTVRCLLKAADVIKRGHELRHHRATTSQRNLEFPHAPTGLSLSKPELEEMAGNFRRDLGVGKDDALDALKIQIVGVDVFTPPEVPSLDAACLSFLQGAGSSEWSAMSIPLDFDEERWAILRNDRHTLERQRVTFLEECWHILLGHRLTRIAKIADSYGRIYDATEEHDAFYLASACLLPKPSVEALVSRRMSSGDIAIIFGTSPELVEYRIKRLGLWRIFKGKDISITTDRK